ncbi:uncharacterized protein LACBIDRAFT_314282 [Laccaria bicolor S238N-H82]|uniref:Predicted protein n=1 Tax=Laccaria bicolor (strain S238N-H82 / ATCC MYA-4686) TaxID=486041 RepID=B0D202_LACBS|nr:uncharacterized protein LACBIDRAFT_314282 [Laccaria bicolor S238N-H82]EDR11732.1 predicted protein [Laccaria bicolor S238N-H82]|eukprot:XP_001877629.1 predicted protein [Laccaria bicolor S238N-H82]
MGEMVSSVSPTLQTPHSSPHKQSSRAKFYLVVVGRQCGVFENWAYVSALTTSISGNSHCSFNTHEASLQNYFEAKRLGLVKVSRLPGDEHIFGPISQAVL